MLQFLRTVDRRYFDAGEAFGRINYDTNMVHTEKHLEIAWNWWPAKGNSHRHNVQPFGCPYIGMRGSYPGGQRILYLLTGDGAIKDGLDIVAETSYQSAEVANSRLCHSSGSDGQGSAANALLWKYETTGDRKYLRACRKLLDRSGLVPPGPGKRLGYGPSFGLFNAAGEYADLTGDKPFTKRVIEVGNLGVKGKGATRFIHPIAMAVKFTGDEKLRVRLTEIIKAMSDRRGSSLAELPVERWPGHAGFRVAQVGANALRDYACALGVLTGPVKTGTWPAPRASAKPIPASPPTGWFTPGGKQQRDEDVPSAGRVLSLAPGEGGGKLTVGKAVLTAGKTLCDDVKVGAASPLTEGVVPYVNIMTPKDGDPRLAAKFEVFRGRVDKMGPAPDGSLVAAGKAGPAEFTAVLRKVSPDGAAGLRVEMACRIPEGSGHVASWGLLIPLKLGDDPHAIQTTGPGRFRLERCRLDQNDERIPQWLTSEYHWGEGAPLWPKWRESGINIGPGRYYRIWRANRTDVSPLFCDQGEGCGNWLDITDRGQRPHWGLTARVLRPSPAELDTSRQGIRVNLETGVMLVQFHDAAAEPLSEPTAPAQLAGAADLIFHDGWRPPLAKPELTAKQYEKFMDDLDYGGNYGLFALRFCLSITHKVEGRQWADKVRDMGIEPREVLYGMLYKDALGRHCKKIGVKWDPNDIESSVRRVIDHYRQ
jgi:hypothetical protein